MIIVDGNSVGFSATAGKSIHAGSVETNGVLRFLLVLREVKLTYKDDIVVVWDGRSWRYEAFEEYKANRKSNPDLVALKERWEAQKSIVVKALNYMGIKQVFSKNMEADDLAAKIAKKTPETERIVFVTGDSDWLQLLRKNDLVVDLVNRRVTHLGNLHERVGLPTVRQYVEAKALMGDSSDCIKGVGGVGEKNAAVVMQTYGSVQSLLDAPPEDIDLLPKPIREFVRTPDKIAKFHENLKLIDLYHPDVPKCNDLQVIGRSMNKEALIELFGSLAFLNILRDFDHWIKPFEKSV